MLRISDVRLDRLSLSLISTKRNVRGTAQPRQPGTLSCLFGAISPRGIDVSPGQKSFCRAPSSVLRLSINVGLKEISGSKQLRADEVDEGADLTDDISVDISTLAAPENSPSTPSPPPPPLRQTALIFPLISLTQMSAEMNSCYLFVCFADISLTWTIHQSSRNLCPSKSLLYEKEALLRSDTSYY